MTKKHIINCLVCLLVGSAIGAIFVCYLSSLASSSFVDIISISYQEDQRSLADNFKRNGDFDNAITHYRNLVSASSGQGLPCFKSSTEFWDFYFPFRALILSKISSDLRSPVGIKRVEAINRVMLADALEKGGRHKEAMEQYSVAAKVLGCNGEIDIDRLKKFITH